MAPESRAEVHFVQDDSGICTRGTYDSQACILTGVGQHGQVWAVQDSGTLGRKGGLLGRGVPVLGQEWEGPGHSGLG